MQQAFIKTPLGTVAIHGDEYGIAKILISDDGESESEIIADVLKPAVTQLHEYFNGERKSFDFKVNQLGTDFQKKVWNALMHIPYGQTMSYFQLSEQLGDIKAIRAVASANGKNPLWIVVPCHRVIGTNGSLTGYAGRLWRKKWLLEHENPLRQQSLF